ncbi:hypothetical protein [Actinorhabdospora filicis]|nr:hypothetical protein [Actinorhabdospora filicis]
MRPGLFAVLGEAARDADALLATRSFAAGAIGGGAGGLPVNE